MSCRLTAFDFTQDKSARHLFPKIDPTEIPESAGHPVDGAVAGASTVVGCGCQSKDVPGALDPPHP